MKGVKRFFKLLKRYRYFLIFAIIFFSFNAYAWFTYVTRVDTSLTAKVRSWNVMFQVHDNNIAHEVSFDAADIYPGMPRYNDLASIVNTGDTSGDAYFVVKKVEIFGEVLTSQDYTTEELVNKLANDYPFKIDLSLSDTHVLPGHTELFNVDITWPYESGNDTLDTEWGTRAYQFRNSRPGDPCVSMVVEIRVDQSQIQE